MQLKNKIVLAAASVALTFVFTSLDIESTSGAPSGKTGSPGDNSNCTSCHSGTATTLAGAITSDIPASGYVPGNVYTITATVSDPVKNKFGFSVSPQKTTGTKVGTLTITDATRTQLNGAGKYVTHKTAGTAGTSNSNTWSFQWTAPAAGTGNFTFYGAFVLANANSATSGDVVKLSTLAVTEDLTTSIDENDVKAFTVFPSPAIDFISCSIKNTNGGRMKIYSLKGEIVKDIAFGAGEEFRAEIAGIAAGMYVLQLETAGKTMTKKFIKG